MKYQTNNILKAIAWFLFRLFILNASITLLVSLIAASRIFIENSAGFEFVFPFRLSVTAYFLTNLVYVTGIVFEIFYLCLWNKKVDFKLLEKKFFPVGMAMMCIVCVVAVLLYFISFFQH